MEWDYENATIIAGVQCNMLAADLLLQGAAWTLGTWLGGAALAAAVE